MQQFAHVGFPEMYEQALVPPLFRPWAEDIVALVNVRTGDRVLDVACGTGIVARLAKECTGAAGSVVGVDVNPAMLAVARQQAPDIAWHEGDAVALPVKERGVFEVVICQQGLQFVPDRVTAIAEMRRVLAPAGRLAVSTWRSDEEMPVLRELRAIAERHVGPIADRRHDFADADELRRLLLDAGFSDVRVTPSSKTIRFADGATFVSLNAVALIGMSSRSQELGNEARLEAAHAIVAESRDLIDANTDARGFAYVIGANIATAIG
jgi:ubiquinone/menaquinone biosynthesis C-methylase UbiE